MSIVVGSRNSTKIEAVRDITFQYRLWRGLSVHGIEVDSGVSPQPMGLEETLLGANNRAAGTLRLTSAQWGVGIEGGLIPLPATLSGYGEVTFCAIHGRDGQQGIGGSPIFEHPPAVIEYLLAKGGEVSDAYRECGLTDLPKIGEAMGSVGLLTQSRMDRCEYTKQAIMMALIQIENHQWYRGR